ncbi:MAG: aminotransferase class I/II-fold pyridoxal phosphate-dependent enzyme [Legionellales bacterium]|nr:aminotransferase class I/II-fold pyridoxal phosphate-dependent enzyme [Legionellales bacterium]
MSQFKESLLHLALRQRRSRLQEKEATDADRVGIDPVRVSRLEKRSSFEDDPNYQAILQKQWFAKKMKIASPFFLTHEGIASATSTINGQSFINFSSYNYLDLNGDPRVAKAAKEAIDQYGMSASASRLVSGERPIHQTLEKALAQLHHVDKALVFVSGHATNVTSIGYLFGQKDLVIHDEFIHDSVLQGAKLSGAFRMSFPHNDWQALDHLLTARRSDFERVLLVVEGLYSMDGDYPDLPQLIAIKKRHQAFLMVDEAHSIGVMGLRGGGIGEFFDIDAREVDIWMGTLSKTLAGCGGYIAGSDALIEHLKYAAPGFLYSVGMSPPLAAASLKALEIMHHEPYRIAKLNQNAKQFFNEAKDIGLNVGFSQGLSIVPILYGSSKRAVQVANHLHLQGINVQPIIYPAVPDNRARLRFFMSSAHTSEQISCTLQALAEQGK